MGPARYLSVCPLVRVSGDWDRASFPVKITDSLSVADVSQVIQETNFDPLTPQFYSGPEVKKLQRIRYALVRYFDCKDQERPSEDEQSARQLYQLYLGLKVIRPTAGRFQVLHYDMSQSIPRMPRGERNDNATILCDCEVLNSIRWTDLQKL